ncbi:MAG: AAA-like domain-containing protein [Geitlerinemataceae cyanobacterium]
MGWDKDRMRRFREALQDVYRSYSRLQIFVSDALGENLEGIAGRADLETTTFNLLNRLDSDGTIDALHAAFCVKNSHHEFARAGGASPVASPDGTPAAGRTVYTQGGDYYETNVSGQGQYAGRDIHNRTENKQQVQQQGVNANDSASVTIQNQTIHYHNPPRTEAGGIAGASGSTQAEPAPEESPETIEPPYISRRSIERTCRDELVRPGSLVRIKAPHRFGKTELILQLRQFAEGEGYKVVTLDLCRVELPSLESLDKFLRWFCKRIARKLRIKEPLDEYWDDELGSNTSCSDYIEAAILENLDEPLVLALDNVDALFDRQPIVLEFFKLLRSWYETARREPEWQKWRLILAHSTEPYEFLKISESHHSPFNVGEPIELPAFDRVQVSELVTQFGLAARVDLDRLYEMLDGHPELLQIGLKFLRLDGRRTLDDLQAESRKVEGKFSSHLNELERLLRKSGHLAAMRRVAKSVEPFTVERGKVERDTAAALVRFGLVKDGDRCIVPRCDLYRQHFRDLA